MNTNDTVSVPRKLLESAISILGALEATVDLSCDLREASLLAQSAEQNRAEQNRAEPVAWQAMADACAEQAINQGIKNYAGSAYTVTRDSGEQFEVVVTVQRAGAKSVQEINEELRAQLAAWQALAADRLEMLTEWGELLRQCIENEEGFSFDHDLLDRIKAALSISAEPVAPTSRYENLRLYVAPGESTPIEGSVTITAAPIERDERAEVEGPRAVLQELMDEDVAVIYPSAIEQNHPSFNFETWAKRARAALSASAEPEPKS